MATLISAAMAGKLRVTAQSRQASRCLLSAATPWPAFQLEIAELAVAPRRALDSEWRGQKPTLSGGAHLFPSWVLSGAVAAIL